MTSLSDNERFATPDELLALHAQGASWLKSHGVPMEVEILGHAPNGLPISNDALGFEARLSGRKTRFMAPQAAGAIGVGSHIRLSLLQPSYEPEILLLKILLEGAWLYFDVFHTYDFSPTYASTGYAIGVDEDDDTDAYFETTNREGVRVPFGGAFKNMVTNLNTGSDLITFSQFSDLQTVMHAWQRWACFISPGRSRKPRW